MELYLEAFHQQVLQHGEKLPPCGRGRILRLGLYIKPQVSALYPVRTGVEHLHANAVSDSDEVTQSRIGDSTAAQRRDSAALLFLGAEYRIDSPATSPYAIDPRGGDLNRSHFKLQRLRRRLRLSDCLGRRQQRRDNETAKVK